MVGAAVAYFSCVSYGTLGRRKIKKEDAAEEEKKTKKEKGKKKRRRNSKKRDHDAQNRNAIISQELLRAKASVFYKYLLHHLNSIFQ
jgi:hypothetical protein